MKEHNYDALCFAYNPTHGTCRALKEKSEFCNTPLCPFFKPNKEYRAELVKVKQRIKAKGLNYYE